MRVTVVRPGDLGQDEAVLWTRFQRCSPQTLSPFMSFTFTQAVGRARLGARVAVVEDAGEIRAFLPFELTSLKMAVPIGSPMNDLQGFIGDPGNARKVIRRAGVRGWRFAHAPAGQAALKPHCYPESVVQCPVIGLADGYEAWHGSRSRSLTKQVAGQRRALERLHGAVSLEWHSPQHLDRLIDWKSGKYYSSRRLFSDPSARRIIEELAAARSEDCRGVVSVLTAGGLPVAAHYGLLGPGGLASWFPAYDPDLSRFSPGTMMDFALAEEAAGRGIAQIDLGYGQDAYKFRFASEFHEVMGGAVWAIGAEREARRTYRRFRAGQGQHVARDGSGDGPR
jgi:CelD/BcsL family acetyltransferase involved in cellulose biosynthesis